FAAVSETAYGIVARNRGLASAVTGMLWGDEVRKPHYFAARRWFLRALGAIYLIAFISLWVQVDGLIGTGGILPIAEYLSAARAQIGANSVFQLPTLCWLNSSNTFLHFLCGSGAVISLLLIAEIAPLLCLAALFVLYLSLSVAGQTFLEFQWDILLLETGFLAIFFAPWQWWPKAGRAPPCSRIGLFLLKLLLFKLMFLSGVVKLTSGDESWWKLTALDYHYWTQPLPTVFAWYADQSPEWLKKITVAAALFVELVVPFFIWAPRRPRLVAFALLVSFQLGIALTGNYAFFNLLTISLCLLLLDDAVIGRRKLAPAAPDRARAFAGLLQSAAILGLLLTLPLNLMLFRQAFEPEAPWPHALGRLYAFAQPFRIVNSYGLFRVMTKSRPEITIEGSADGSTWLRYEFKWKPGDLRVAPRWVAPHQPRLDWQMWFAALGTPRENWWFLRLCQRLLENNPEVTRLLRHNPFAQAPPRYLRATSYDYRFTSAAERRVTGEWWKRQWHGEYLPTVSLGND
ncbi:MAG TPA: lipase maturation factor family protein, partial [Chthoniobacterales bacterium]|nr:lipase maturation factor family protein [Chthoniobacterales bacterium]